MTGHSRVKLAYSDSNERFDFLHQDRQTRRLSLDAHDSDPPTRTAGKFFNTAVLDAKPFGDGLWKIRFLLDSIMGKFEVNGARTSRPKCSMRQRCT